MNVLYISNPTMWYMEKKKDTQQCGDVVYMEKKKRCIHNNVAYVEKN